MPSATSSSKRIWRAMSAPRVQRVSIRSRLMLSLFVAMIEQPLQPYRRGRGPTAVCDSRNLTTCGMLAIVGGEQIALELDVVGQEQLADARRVGCAAEILEQQRIIEVVQPATLEPSRRPILVPIQHARMQWPTGWPFGHVQRGAQGPEQLGEMNGGRLHAVLDCRPRRDEPSQSRGATINEFFRHRCALAGRFNRRQAVESSRVCGFGDFAWLRPATTALTIPTGCSYGRA